MARPKKATSEAEVNDDVIIADVQEQKPEPKPTAAPKKKLVGTGEGLTSYDLCLINIAMGNREGKNGQIEGTATKVQVIDKIRTSKNPRKTIELQNKHVGGCILAAPGNPNHCTWWFESGTVNVGTWYKAETIIHKTMPGAPAITDYKTLAIYTDQPL